jgi:hypothetical protein
MLSIPFPYLIPVRTGSSLRCRVKADLFLLIYLWYEASAPVGCLLVEPLSPRCSAETARPGVQIWSRF